MSLKHLSLCMSVGFLLSIVPLRSAVSETTVQQERIANCNAAAQEKQLVGEARKAFMRSCVRGNEIEVATGTIKEEKVKRCSMGANKDVLTGAARKKFMNHCLKQI